MELQDARVLVVGASSGIGRAVARQAAAGGARVVLAARRADKLAEAAAEAGERATTVVCDVRQPEQCEQVVRDAAGQLGGLDVVVYATAVDPLVRLIDTDAEQWRTVYETNVFGASLVTRAALAPLTESGGRMVFISASSVGRPLPGMGAYETSKAALDELVRAWRGEHPEIGFCNVAVGNTLGHRGVPVVGPRAPRRAVAGVGVARATCTTTGRARCRSTTARPRCWRRSFRRSTCATSSPTPLPAAPWTSRERERPRGGAGAPGAPRAVARDAHPDGRGGRAARHAQGEQRLLRRHGDGRRGGDPRRHPQRRALRAAHREPGAADLPGAGAGLGGGDRAAVPHHGHARPSRRRARRTDDRLRSRPRRAGHAVLRDGLRRRPRAGGGPALHHRRLLPRRAPRRTHAR